MTDHMEMDCKLSVYMNGKVVCGETGSPKSGSPRSRSKAKSIMWLKQTLQNAGCVINEGDKGSHVIDNCFQVPLPVLQKYSAALVRENRSNNILNSLPFKNILQNICALRSEYVMRIAKPILQKLMSHDRNRNTFNQPVDPVELGIPNYFAVVTEPMDLGTVMGKLRAGKYCTIQACFSDVELVFRNAMLFNHASHEVHKMARDLQKDFHAEVALAEDKCTKECEKRTQHSCSLCCGSTCQLCGEKCLKYESPSLNCQQCGTRIKKNGIFYVCADGSALWCQKCYVALPPVIVAGAPRPLHGQEGRGGSSEAGHGSGEGHEGGGGGGGSSNSSSALPSCEDAGVMQQLQQQEDTACCAISSCDSESIHEPCSGTGGSHHHHHDNAVSISSHRDRDGHSSDHSSSEADAPLLKKHLLKRRADEELAEPWVACDSCGNWYHQICAMYSKLGESDAAAKTFCCPFCVLLASDGADMEQCQGDVAAARKSACAVVGTSAVAAGRRSRCSSWVDSGISLEAQVSTLTSSSEDSSAMDVCTTQSLVLSIPVPENITAASASSTSAMDGVTSTGGPSSAGGRLTRGLSVKFEAEDTLFKNIFEYSDLSAPHSLACTPKRPDLPSDYFSAAAAAALEEAVAVEGGESHGENGCNVGVAFVSANSSCAGTGLTSEDERLLDDESLNGQVGQSSAAMDTTEEVEVEEVVPEVVEEIVPVVVHACPPTPMRVVEPAPAPQVGAPALDLGWKWRASSLPRTQLGDFLQALVQDLLVANDFPEAASSVTVRMTSNKDMPLEVPASIVQNLVSPTGHVIPACLGYKQKCILLFQEVDGVDVCLFSLYVHEFDAQCPSPNTSTVYIAYLDSVDYFRPVAARTMVYQEIVAGYLKWSQARGFKQAHIWSCPPHRGDNFIFNAHPAHQKYPSRERLNQWYKSILQRCSRLGVIAETGNLWQQYFSKYVRRDALPVVRQAALNSFVGSGKVIRRANAKPKVKGQQPQQEQAVATASSAVTVTAAPATLAQAPLESAVGNALTTLPTPAAAAAPAQPQSSALAAAVALSCADAPVCPPIFDGDYWVQQYVYLVRLHTQRGRNQSTASQRQQLGLRKFRELLKRLMNREESAPFLHPVDHIALDIPHYALIVKQPMDMNTVREKLNAGEYPTAAEFVKDVRLIFSNAKLFNPADHAVYAAADFLSQKFEHGLALAIAELREPSGNGLLRMPLPGEEGSCPGEGDGPEAFLKSILLSFSSRGGSSHEVPTAAAASHSSNCIIATTSCAVDPPRREDPCCATPAVPTTEGITGCGTGKRPELGYSTPPCKAVSRSGSLCEEKEFFVPPGSPCPRPCPRACPELTAPALSGSNGTRSRAQSITITPVTTSSTAAALLPPPRSPCVSAGAGEKTEVESVSSDAELEEESAKRRLQHVVSQDFSATPAIRFKSGSDDKRKALEEACNAECTSPENESANKRRRLTEDNLLCNQMVVSRSNSQSAEVVRTASESATTVQEAEEKEEGENSNKPFSAVELNTAHQAVNFTAPALGSQNTMTIVAELSKRMQRQYDDLFVIKLAPPGRCAETASVNAAKEPAVPVQVHVAGATSKKVRGRVAVIVKKTPAMHVPGGLKNMGPACRALLGGLTPDTADPDPAMHSPVTDSRHVFLELCQFRHYQFDSLRRAKHSSLMLLYHLQHPLDKRCHACCSGCDAQIQTLRWHCDECPNFDLCGSCYATDQARRSAPLHLSHRPSFSIDAGDHLEPVFDTAAVAQQQQGRLTGEAGLPLPHPHVLTPYRVSNH